MEIYSIKPVRKKEWKLEEQRSPEIIQLRNRNEKCEPRFKDLLVIIKHVNKCIKGVPRKRSDRECVNSYGYCIIDAVA